MMSWTQSSMSSKKGIALALGTMVTYIIVIVVFVVLGGIVFQQPLKEMVTSFADEKLAELENESEGAQGEFNKGAAEANQLQSETKEISDVLNFFEGSTNCVIKLNDLFSNLDSYDKSVRNDFSISFVKEDDVIKLKSSRKSVGSSGDSFYELNGITGVNLLTDKAPVLKNSNTPVSQIRGLLYSEFDTFSNGFGYYETERSGATPFIIVPTEDSFDLNQFPLLEEGEFSKQLGNQKYLLKEYLFKVEDKLFFYSGDSSRWFGFGSVNPEDIEITENQYCKE